MRIWTSVPCLAASFGMKFASRGAKICTYPPYLQVPLAFQSLQHTCFFFPLGLVPRSLLFEGLVSDFEDCEPFPPRPRPLPLGDGVGSRPLSSFFFFFMKAPCFAGSCTSGQVPSFLGHFPFFNQFLQSSDFCFGGSGLTAGIAV